MEYKYKSVNIFKIKHFLKINRTNRDERDVFMLFLNFEKLLDKCLVSFPELHKWPEYQDMLTLMIRIKQITGRQESVKVSLMRIYHLTQYIIEILLSALLWERFHLTQTDIIYIALLLILCIVDIQLYNLHHTNH